MKDKKTLWIILFLFVLLMGGAVLLYNRLGQQAAPDQLTVLQTQATENTEKQPDATDGDPEETKGQSQQETAPDFTVYDADGKEVRLSDFFGKPIVLNFWASWCGPCQQEMPDFDEKYRELNGEVLFLMVNMTDGSRETVEKALGFVTSQGYTFPVYYDTASDAATTYAVYSLPTTYFLDGNGSLVPRATGAIDAETLQRGIDMIYSQKTQ